MTRAKETGFGLRYEVEGELKALDGRRPHPRTVRPQVPYGINQIILADFK